MQLDPPLHWRNDTETAWLNQQIGRSVSLFQATLEGEIQELRLDEASYRAPIKQFSLAEVTSLACKVDSKELSHNSPVLKGLGAS